MPFATSLLNHNPKLSDLFDCIDSTGREHELLARCVKNNTDTYGQLYTSRKDLANFQDIDILVQQYNNQLFRRHGNRKLESYADYLYIKENEDDTLRIIEKLKELSSRGIKNYSASVDSWLQSAPHKVDSDEKKEKLRQMFENSEVALIYGSAGTGKTRLIEHIASFFSTRSKLYLANTNPAVDNLRRRVDTANSTFMTIAKFLSNRNQDTEFDLLIVDECSTVSNSDMLKILSKANFKLLTLVGDIFQIESIRFGNWFGMIRHFLPETSVSELTKPYRTKNAKLLDLWNRVRNLSEDILEHITKNNYSMTLNESIFDHSEDDEIILCLNYDGLYGINNINRFLQGSNENPAIQWGVHTYKVNDPILFNESERFRPLIYNNLKGRIVAIEVFDNKICFDIELDKVINELDAAGYDFELIDNLKNDNSVVRFLVNKLRSTDEDDDSLSTLVPFQVAYAVSIHKAQGLEYNSVKIVITTEVEERITHNIFYTAITRAREKLKIYWTPETGNKILGSLSTRDNKRDVALFSSKFNL
jgi:ATP-dependent exoDNAse (exonuclease V) alpha subunit